MARALSAVLALVVIGCIGAEAPSDAVRFTYGHAQPPVRWTDTVVVVREGGRYVVADVRYGGDWDFANQGSLIAVLESAMAGSDGP